MCAYEIDGRVDLGLDRVNMCMYTHDGYMNRVIDRRTEVEDDGLGEHPQRGRARHVSSAAACHAQAAITLAGVWRWLECGFRLLLRHGGGWQQEEE